MWLLNRVLALLIAVCLALPASLSSPALANSKFAAIAVDARTGAIISESDSNALRHPASLTKMMTLYLVFQELKAKRISMSTKLKVSARASRMAPSKMGLKPGSTITVEQAIKALIIKSANDVAATVAENLEGSESAFANRMTRTARSLGMSRTVYRNASGLPNPGQVTTARDQATLGLRLMRDFPQYYPFFRLTSFNFKGRIVRSHNRLVGRFEGTDGIKTGYINASGYNLVSSVRRGDRRLVGVVLGGRTAARRDAYMMQMLLKAFPKARGGSTIAAVAGSNKGVIDPIRKLKGKDKRTALEEEAAMTAEESQDKEALAAKAAEISGGQQEEGDSTPKVIESELEQTGAADMTDEGTKADAMHVGSLAPRWAVEIGDFKSKSSAEQIAKKLQLQKVDSKAVPLKRDGKTIYRLLVSGYDKEAAAKRSCARVEQLGKSCAVLAPQG